MKVSRICFALVFTSVLTACNGLQIDEQESPGTVPVYQGVFDFPIAEEHVRYIKGLKAYGISPWGNEPAHNGVDIIVDHSVVDVDEIHVVAPADGVVLVKQVVENPNVNLNWVLLVIGVIEGTCANPQIQPATAPEMLVALAFEPQTDDPAIFSRQWNRITVETNECVNRGETLGYLQVDHQVLASEHYVHIDYRILIDPQRMGIKELMGNQDQIGHSCRSDWPTFVCPLMYSSSNAREKFQRIITRNPDPQFFCSCVCKGGLSICKTPVDNSQCGEGCR